MIASLEYIERKFREYNDMIFDGTLAVPSFRLSNALGSLGQLRYRKTRTLFGKERKYDFTLCISRLYDFEPEALNDIIIHEMIHYFIDSRQIADTSAHGKEFRRMMNDINFRYGRHVSISAHRHNLPAIATRKQRAPRLTVFCVVELQGGTMGIAAVATTRIREISRLMLSSPEVVKADWYTSTSEFFAALPRFRTLKITLVPHEEIECHLAEAKPLHF